MNQALTVSSLKKTFRVGLRRTKVEAVKDVSFSVEQGEVVGLIGPNGAGKTTTMKCITGLVRAEQGEISLMGKSVSDTASRNELGYLPEGPYFYEHLKIEELLRFYGRLFGIDRSTLETRVESLVQKVGLDHARNRTLGKFSKGMRQRAGMAQALINDPKFLILDEPQTGLDPSGRKDMRDIILELNREEKTILFSSHILADVEAVCDRVVMIHEGNVVGTGTIDALTAGQTEVVDVMIEGKLPAGFEVASLSIDQLAHATLIRIPNEEDPNVWIKKLVDAECLIQSVTPHRLGLEDVFLAKTDTP